MANLKNIFGAAFDPNAVPQDDNAEASFDVLPAGVYTVEITDAEIKDTKTGNGQYIKIAHAVLEPAQFARRKLWNNINIRNPNAQAEQIGAQQLASLCRAAGISVLSDTDELIGKVVRARVAVKAASGQYAESNVVKAYEGATTFAPKSAPADAKPGTASAKTPPWAKKA